LITPVAAALGVAVSGVDTPIVIEPVGVDGVRVVEAAITVSGVADVAEVNVFDEGALCCDGVFWLISPDPVAKAASGTRAPRCIPIASPPISINEVMIKAKNLRVCTNFFIGSSFDLSPS
jgi:hypothetical protein